MAIKDLFNYEEANNTPEEYRLTTDPYKNIPEIPESSPRAKAYIDIRRIEGMVRDLKYRGEI